MHPVSSGEPVYRVVRAGNDPWWFSSSGDGRFDLEAPAGTCYLARQPLHALVEIIGSEVGSGTIGQEFLDRRRMCSLEMPKRAQLADCTSNRARGYGLTAELGTIVPYDCPHQWAAALRSYGTDGIRYQLRHVAAGAAAIALFDDASVEPAAAQRRSNGHVRTQWHPGTAAPITREQTDLLARDFSIRVARIPLLRDLELRPGRATP